MPGSKRKILLIDQDPQYAQFIAERLRVFGYDVVTAQEEIEALADAKDQNPELVLLDFTLPKDDFHFMKTFKRMYDQIPVIMVTEADDAATIRQAFDMGMTDYVVKPFELSMFLDKVKKALH